MHMFRCESQMSSFLTRKSDGVAAQIPGNSVIAVTIITNKNRVYLTAKVDI